MDECDNCLGVGRIVCGKHPANNVFGWDYDFEDCEVCHGTGKKRQVIAWSYPYE